MIILRYEFLDKKRGLVKTIKGDCYGIWNLKNNKEVFSPRFQHIFPFVDRLAVAISIKNSYIGITEFGEEIPLSKATIDEYKNYIIKGSICNCQGDGCKVCNHLGFIPNKYGLKINL